MGFRLRLARWLLGPPPKLLAAPTIDEAAAMLYRCRVWRALGREAANLHGDEAIAVLTAYIEVCEKRLERALENVLPLPVVNVPSAYRGIGPNGPLQFDTPTDRSYELWTLETLRREVDRLGKYLTREHGTPVHGSALAIMDAAISLLILGREAADQLAVERGHASPADRPLKIWTDAHEKPESILWLVWDPANIACPVSLVGVVENYNRLTTASPWRPPVQYGHSGQSATDPPKRAGQVIGAKLIHGALYVRVNCAIPSGKRLSAEITMNPPRLEAVAIVEAGSLP